LDATAVETLLAAAVAAPSLRDTQPWRFRCDPHTGAVEIHAAPERVPRSVDPCGRGLYLSAGAALFNVRTAAEHLGWEPEVRLLPRPEESGLLAVVAPGDPQSATHVPVGELYGAVWRRHSSRLPFSTDPVPDLLMAKLAAAARTEGANLHVLDESEAQRLLSLTAEAQWRVTRGTRIRQARSTAQRHAIRDTPAGGGLDGPPAHLPYPIPWRDVSGSVRGPVARGRPSPPAVGPRPRLLLLDTAGDTTTDWLRAGQALQRVLLTATHHCLRASLLHQALEWADLRRAMHDSRPGSGHPQMLLRVGYGPEGPPAGPFRAMSGPCPVQ
jgi:hypothetical protein